MSQQNGTQRFKQKSIANLWKSKSKKGQTYYSGYLRDSQGNDLKVVMFENGFKRDGKRDPDLMMYLNQPQEEQPVQVLNDPQNQTPGELPF